MRYHLNERKTGKQRSCFNNRKAIYIEGYNESTEPIDAVNILPLARFVPTTMTIVAFHQGLALHQTSTLPTASLRHPKKGCSGSADIDVD